MGLYLEIITPTVMNRTMRVNTHQQQPQQQRGRSSWTESTVLGSSNDGVKRKSRRRKLTFHHLALPIQYQRHCANLPQLDADAQTPLGPPSASAAASPSPSPSPPPPCRRGETRGAAIGAGAEGGCASSSVLVASAAIALPTGDGSPSGPRTTVNFADLPYMGEMTLEKAAVRRGRKPKKADICHLIYKNYGTTVVDEPLNLCVRDCRLRDGPAAKSTIGGDDGDDGDDGDGRDGRLPVGRFEFAAAAHATSSPTARARVTAADAWSASAPRRSPKKSRLLARRLGRKSRKSTARERLEKTFAERGFLIQTQRLESAQGATYCKFRQLRKFTRYLFRSWKQHLPGDVVDK